MALDPLELVGAVEAVVFVSSEPVTSVRLLEVFPEETAESIQAALESLAQVFEQPGRGLLLDRVAGGYRIATRPDVHPHVARFVQQERAERLSLRTLETLSVIAYKQPVTAAEIGEIRGVDPTGTIKTLMDRTLVKIVGRKKVVGRPFVYGTTNGFLTTFGLNDLSELPTLKELEEFVTDVPTTDPSEVEPDGAAPADPDPTHAEPLPEPAADEAETVAGSASDVAAGDAPDRDAPRGRSRRKR